MPALRRICVFCGASAGHDPAYRALATELGAGLASRGIGIVYGGGHVGLMGAVADASLAAGGEVIGVIPQGLVDRELAHPGLTELRIVRTLHERKATMAELADAFIALPGGLGTLEELAEVVSWAQLQLHAKPIGLLDDGRYWSSLLAWLDHAVDEGFVSSVHRGLLLRSTDLDDLLGRLGTWSAPPDRWAAEGTDDATGAATSHGDVGP
ncbi:MAG: TIGR00730 family Rossman fold protein [Candidatus Limnocylindrales bacterium]